MTKEEIIKHWYLQDPELDADMFDHWKQNETYPLFEQAMSDYATQCTAPLEARIRELEGALFKYHEVMSRMSKKEANLLGYDDKELYVLYEQVNKLLSSSSQTP